MISLLFIILAAFFKACSDTMAHHYSTSVFRKWSYRFFDPSVSWQYAKKIFDYPVDGWHISNSLMIVSFCVAYALHTPLYAWWIEVLIAGLLFNGCFNLSYNKILRRK